VSGFLVDTDVFVDHLKAGRMVPVPPERAAYSSIARAELYAGSRAVEAILDDLLGAFLEIPVDRAVAEVGGRIRRDTGLALPDALVAATAIVTGRRLVTRNDKHFAGVGGLKLHKPKR
jgi:hypothetical protein